MKLLELVEKLKGFTPSDPDTEVLAIDAHNFVQVLYQLCAKSLVDEEGIPRWTEKSYESYSSLTERFCAYFSVDDHLPFVNEGGKVTMNSMVCFLSGVSPRNGPATRQIVLNILNPLKRKKLVVTQIHMVVRLCASRTGWSPPVTRFHDIHPLGEIPKGLHVCLQPLVSVVNNGPDRRFFAVERANQPEVIIHKMAKRPRTDVVVVRPVYHDKPVAGLTAGDLRLCSEPPCFRKLVEEGSKRKLGYQEFMLVGSCISKFTVDMVHMENIWHDLFPDHGNSKWMNRAKDLSQSKKYGYGCRKVGAMGLCPKPPGELCENCLRPDQSLANSLKAANLF